jgi:hypothetical protein
VVRRVVGVVEVEERVTLCLDVAVEKDRGIAAGSRLAAYQRMLAALAVARRIGEGPVGLRHRPIVFLDASAHLGDDTLA